MLRATDLPARVSSTTRGAPNVSQVRLVAAVAAVNALTFAVPNAFGVFLPLIAADTQHGLGAVAVIPAVGTGVQLGASSLAGLLVIKVGARRTMALGGLLLVLGLGGAAGGRSLWHIGLSFGVVGGFGGACLYVPGLSLVGSLSGRRTGLALGVVSAASAAGAALAGILGQMLAASLGWRAAFVIIAVAEAVGLVIALRCLPKALPALGSHPKQRARVARTFPLLYIFALVGSFGYTVPFVHLVAAAGQRGIDATTAVAALGALNVANAVGRLTLGGLADRMGARRVMLGATAMAATATLLLASSSSVLWLWVAAVSFGFFGGAFVTLPPALVSECCQHRSYAPTLGLLLTGYAGGALFGPPAVGQLAQSTGSYDSGLLLTAGMLLLSTLALAFIRSPNLSGRAAAAGIPRQAA